MHARYYLKPALLVLLLALAACSDDSGVGPTGPLAQVADSPTSTTTSSTVPGSTAPPSTDAPSVADTTSTTTTTAATTTTTVGGSSSTSPAAAEPPTELELALAEIIPFVEAERGHEFTTPPIVTQLESDKFVGAFAAVVERNEQRYAEDYANFTEIYQAMGIIPSDDDLASIWASFGDAGVLGFYDRVEKQVFLRGTSIDEFTRIVLAHELVHALDDQVHGIERPEYDDRDDEIGWAFSALLEGNARVIEKRYRASLTSAERAAADAQQRALPRGTSLRTFTDSFLELQAAKYIHGERLMDALWGQGQDAVDAAMASPPTVSEHVLDPNQFLDGEPPDDGVGAPPAEAAVFEQGVWGQIGIESILRDELDGETAQRAAAGWGGDWYVAWTAGTQTCVRLDVRADTPEDLDELAAAFEIWSVRGDREVYFPTADLVRVTACG